ncbi:MAG: hypothetical protein INQ03_08765 [Candidatus Heimdallarchaeota archaeon]|nr:hypothetical protein [Candidatus Heimdallarchaeota archaeon]
MQNRKNILTMNVISFLAYFMPYVFPVMNEQEYDYYSYYTNTYYQTRYVYDYSETIIILAGTALALISLILFARTKVDDNSFDSKVKYSYIIDFITALIDIITYIIILDYYSSYSDELLFGAYSLLIRAILAIVTGIMKRKGKSEIFTSVTSSMPNFSPTKILPKTGSYIGWGFLLFFTQYIKFMFLFGFSSIFIGIIINIPYLIYIQSNMKNLQKLNWYTHNTKSKNFDIYFVLQIIFYFVPILYYLKYKQLHQHLLNDHRGENKFPPNPILASLTLSLFLSLVHFMNFIIYPYYSYFEYALIFQLIIFIVAVVLESKWQNIFNEHLNKHIAYLQY